MLGVSVALRRSGFVDPSLDKIIKESVVLLAAAQSGQGVAVKEAKRGVLDSLFGISKRRSLAALASAVGDGDKEQQAAKLVAKWFDVRVLSREELAARGRLETVDGHEAVLGKISVNGQQLDTLLTEGSFDKTRQDQEAYAQELGYRLATREEHLAYLNGLLGKEADGFINAAESKALENYRRKYVRDTLGGLDVDGRRVGGDTRWHDRAAPDYGALFVRASAESK